MLLKRVVTMTATSWWSGKGSRLGGLARPFVRVNVRGGSTMAAFLVAASLACTGSEPSAPDLDPLDECAPRVRIALSPGEARTLPGGPVHCLTFEEEGEYALAFFDTGPLESWRSGPGYVPSSFDAFTAEIGRVGGAMAVIAPGAPAEAVPASHRPAHHDAVTERVSGDGWAACTDPAQGHWCRETPWVAGDEFEMLHHEGDSVVTLRIAHASERLVAAYYLHEWAAMQPHHDRVGSILDEAEAQVVPFLRTALVDTDVTTSAGSGQLLIVAHLGPRSYSAAVPVSEGGAHSFIALSVSPSPVVEYGRDRIMALLVHELAHSWQFAHLYGDPDRYGASVPRVGRYGFEGAATFIEQEYLRVTAGIDLEPNAPPLEVPVTDSYAGLFRTQVHRGRGRFESGYDEVEPLLRRFMIQNVRAGLSQSEARRSVALGATEGWFGWTGSSWVADGLTGRMRAIGDPGWDPTVAVLEYLVATALDDRPGAGSLHNPVVFEAWRRVGISGFPADEAVSLGSNAVVVRKAAGAGGWVTVDVDDAQSRLRVAGSTNLHDHAAPDTGVRADVRWMVARIR